ncbi:MAG: hypothetical protein CH6_0219 [Candidatus Kapaibacterium sp.]|nr:MAG: hypothetical protein CH6_0219 [Candidatus Kapabacteria bacterium]
MKTVFEFKSELIEKAKEIIPHLEGGLGYINIDIDDNENIQVNWTFNKIKGGYNISCSQWNEYYDNTDFLELDFYEWIIENAEIIYENILIGK